MNLVSQYPIWYYFLCLLLGALLSYVLYRKDKKLQEFSKALIYFLMILRFLTISLVAMLFLGPFIRYFSKKINEPIIAIVQDNSASIVQTSDSTFYKTDFQEQRNQFVQALKEDFEIAQFLFSDEMQKTDAAADFTGEITDLSSIAEDINIRYLDQNLAAVICFTDGIYNQGLNPIYQQGVSVPFYAVAMGDTLVKKDLLVNRILNNQIAFQGNDFPVEVEIKTIKSKGEKYKAQIFKGSKKVWEQELEVTSDYGVRTLKTNLKAENSGLNRYTVVLSRLDDEVNYQNNSMDFYIEVIDAKQRILILADAPHPDIRVLREALLKNETYQVEFRLLDDLKLDVSDFDLVVLSFLFNEVQPKLEKIKETLRAKKISSLYILGDQTNLTLWNQEDVGFEVIARSANSNQSQAVFNPSFPLFKLSDEQIATIEKYPPLASMFGNYIFLGQNFVLFNQKIGSVKTESPLISFTEIQNQKVGIIAGEGLWKWRMNNYFVHENHQIFDDLILKTVQYLAVKSDKSYFRISHNNEFKANEKIRFEAQLYNESYEIINDAEVSMVLRDEQGNESSFTFSPFQDSYQLNISALPVGTYTYQSSVEIGGKTYTKKGQFSVKKIQLESAETTANHDLLYQLAKKSGGELVYPNELNKLVELIKARDDLAATTYLEEELEEIINMKWLFFVLIGLLGLEWFIRKYGGAY